MSTEKTPESIGQRFNEIKQEIAARAFSDGDFRASLLSDPHATITSEYGLPDGALNGVNINILEEQPGVLTLPIPPSMQDVELTDEQLEQVSGGTVIISLGVTAAVSISALSGSALAETTSW